MKKQLILLISAWTLFITGLTARDIMLTRDQTLKESRIEARAIWDNNLSYRKWVTYMGGVYVRRDKPAEPVS